MSQAGVPPRDEDAVAEIPPGQDSPGSVQGGGSEILSEDAGSPASGTGAATGDGGTVDVGTLEELAPEVIEEDKGATGD